jgi:hypothetical protein
MKDLKRYAGSRMIDAKPMTRGEYNALREWELPENENAEDEGYLVLRQRQGDDYLTWVPKEIFEEEYQSCEEGLPFSIVLDQVLHHGARASRKGWNGKKMFIFLVPGSEFEVSREPLLSILGEKTKVKYRGHIDMKTADGSIVPWIASQSDLQESDWTFV